MPDRVMLARSTAALLLACALPACGARGPLDDDVAARECPAAGPGEAWSRDLGRSPPDSAGRWTAAVVDPAGDIVVAAAFSGTIDFGCERVSSAGPSDYLLAKLDAQGRLRWARRFGGGAHVAASVQLGVDGAGRIVLAASGHDDALEIDGTTLDGGLFLASFDPEGALRWARLAVTTTDGYEPTWALGVSRAGRIALTGGYEDPGGLDFGLGPLPPPVAETRLVYIALWDDAGTPVHSRSFADLEGGAGGIAFADDETAIVGGSIGGGPFGGPHQGFSMKLDAAGSRVWSRLFPPLTSGPTAVAVDLTGATLAGFGSITPDSAAAGFFARLDTLDGSTTWSLEVSQIAPPQDSWGAGILPSSVARLADGRVVSVGQFAGTVDFGSGPVVGAGAEDAFLVSIDPAGAASSGRRFGGPAYQSFASLAPDASGRVVLTGVTEGEMDLGEAGAVGGHCSGPDCLELFIARLEP